MTIIITLSFAGNETGPFDLYSDATGFATPFAQNVSKAALLAGYQVEAPDGTTVIRLDNLNSSCGSVDIYSCATPNCDFTGSIICDVTTTTTTTAEPTTTTTTAYPGVAPCTWSTYGGNSGEIAVYEFNTSLSTAVLVPNDFTTTQGINRPICSTGDKVWLASVTTNDTVAYIREWDINTSGATPTLSYVREMTVDVGGLSYGDIFGRTISTIAVTADNNTLIVGFGAKDDGSISGSMGVYSWDISTSGDINLSESNKISRQIIGFGNTSGIVTELTGMFITNNNNVIFSARFYEDESPLLAGNYIREYIGLPPAGGGASDWSNGSNKPTIILQSVGVPEFSSAWTNPSKAMPLWGVNGLLQVLQPETLEVYNISQTPNYAATLATTVSDDSVWIHTSTGCANVEILSQDDINDCTPTALPILVESNGANYIGPITFTYYGMSVIASSDIIGGLLFSPSSEFTTNCGITIKSGSQTMHGNTSGATLDTPAFSYTLEFPVPVNNIALRTAILNFTDDFRFTTNAASTTITMVAGCRATVQNGNELITDSDTNSPNDGSAEVVVTGSEDFTVLTFVGTNRGNGGPWTLGCTVPSLNCNRIFSEPNQGRDCTPGVCAPQNNWPSSGPEYKKFYSHNVVTDTIEEIPFPPVSAFITPNSGVSENYLINQLNLTDAEGFTTNRRFARYTYDESPTGVPQNLDWDGIVYEIDKNDLPGVFGNFVFGLSTINDDVIVLNYQRLSSAGGGHMVIEAQFVPGSTTLAVTEKFVIPEPFNGGSEHVITLKEDGTTPNKYIALRSNEPVVIAQFDYATGNFEGEVELSAPGNPEDYRTRGDMCVIGDFLYISITDLPNNVTSLWKVNLNTTQWSIVSSDDEYIGGSSGSKPSCRIGNGFTSFDPPPSTTTTTTTLIDGVNTIFSRFDPVTPI